MIQLLVLYACMLCYAYEICAESGQEANIETKIDDCKNLVDRAVKLIEDTPINAACREFANDQKWRVGEIGIFVFVDGGECYVFGNDRRYIWHDFQTKKTIAQEDFITQMLDTGKSGGGLINFVWNNSYMQAFVRTVAKDGQVYIVGAGFYPDSGKYMTEQMISNALDYASTRPLSRLIEMINNPTGMFVHGDIYLVLYDYKGKCLAHGKSLELVGQNLINSVSEDGKNIVRDLIGIAKSDKGHGWYEYISSTGNVKKEVYAQRFTADNGKQYVIVGGFYPTLTEADVRSMVKRAVSYMKTHGTKQAFAEISQPRGPFAYGGITLFVYDLKGTIVADMSNPAFVGQNLINSADADGRYVTRVVIQQAQRYGNGWVSFNFKNAYSMIYIELAKLPDGDFVVGATYYPVGKQVTVRFMVEKAARFLEQTSKEKAFEIFTSGTGDFLRGDVQIEVYSDDGIVFVDGPERQKIWGNDNAIVDEKGTPVVRKMIALAKSGGGWLEYKQNGRTRRSYVKLVNKTRKTSATATNMAKNDEMKHTSKVGPENLIVASGYYL